MVLEECGQLWRVLVARDGDLADGPADEEVVADVWAARADDEPVEALAMVRPSARVAPSAPAPTAVPISGLGILTLLFSLPSRPVAMLSAVTGAGPPGPLPSSRSGETAGALRAASQLPLNARALSLPVTPPVAVWVSPSPLGI